METLLLRLVLPPVTVILAGWVQHRLGPRHSGRLVGLPLTSGPFLVVLLLAEGPTPTVTAARGVVAGQLMVVGFAVAYALLSTTRMRPGRVLAAVVPTVAALAAAAHAWLTAAPALGPSLAGLLASVPLVITVVAPATHIHAGVASARTLLRGTVGGCRARRPSPPWSRPHWWRSEPQRRSGWRWR